MRTSHLLLPLLLTASVLPAQQTPRQQFDDVATALMSAGCPVGFIAERRAMPTRQLATDRPRFNAPSLLVTFTPRNTQPIIKAHITVYGVPPGPHLTPANIAAIPDVTESFQLERRNGESSLTSSSVIAHSMSGIRSVQLTEIEYADGTKWQLPASSGTALCRITPNGFLLVAAIR